jgi:hypothetical protein
MMQYFGVIEGYLQRKYFAVFVYFIGLVGIFASSPRLTDTTHEITTVGARWVYGGELLYAQVWSRYSPQVLAMGAVYNRYINSGVTRFLFELVIYTLIYLLLYKIADLIASACHTKPATTTTKPLVLLLAVAMIIAPDVWQRGIYPSKISLLLLCLAVYTYYKWRASKPSYWLMGATTKNWRYMLAFGVSTTLLVHVSILNFIFVVPLAVDLVIFCRKNNLSMLRWGTFLYASLLTNFWVLYSVFSSRGQLLLALKMTMLGVNSQLRQPLEFNSIAATHLVTGGIILALIIAGAKRLNTRIAPGLWALSMLYIMTLVLAPGFAISNLILLLPFMPLLLMSSTNKLFNAGYTASLLALSIVAVVPAIYLHNTGNKLDNIRAQTASAYVQQRIRSNHNVYYYGLGRGFYKEYGLDNPTGFYDPLLFGIDEYNLDLGGKFRGDNEASAPIFVVYATGGSSKITNSPTRIEQYFAKHYTVVETMDDYKILKRK